MTKLRAILRRRWPVLVATLALGVLAGVASASVGPKRETAQYQTEQVIVANRLLGNPANVPQDALKVTRGDVPEVAATTLGEPGQGSALARKVIVTADTDSSSIKLVVYDTDPKRASSIVQAFADGFLQVVNDELQTDDRRQLEQLTERVTAANAAIEAFDAANGFITRPDLDLPQTANVDALVAERRRLADTQAAAQTKLDAAELETSKRAPYTTLGAEDPRIADDELLEVPSSLYFRAGLLGAIGLLLGVGLVMIIERVNQRVDTRDELAALVSVPIIAEIGRIPSRKRPAHSDGRVRLDGIWSEHYRRVRSAIQFVQAEGARSSAGSSNGTNGNAPAAAAVSSPSSAVISGHRSQSGGVPRVFLFASALPGEGKSTSVALTALALSETGMDTLVINADFRRPQVENYLGGSRSPSLADRAEMSTDRPSVDDVVQATSIDHLWIAAAGDPTHEVGGRLQAAREVAAEAAARGGTVLIDSSPLRVSNDPIDLLPAVDEVILVVRAGRTTVKSLEDTVELLEMHHAPVLGVVLIGTLATREMYAYYQSYYQEATQADDRHHGPTPGDDGEPVDTDPSQPPATPTPPAFTGAHVRRIPPAGAS